MIRSLFVLLLLVVNVRSQTIERLDKSTITAAALSEKIESLMQAANVHGLAIAIFNKNEAVYKKAFGYKRVDTKELLNTSTVFYGASFSKAVFAVLVMQLVNEGVIELDKPLQSYLPKPIYVYEKTDKWHEDFTSLKDDTLYQLITARMCLSHTSGLPNWRWFEPDYKLSVKFKPGSKYSYSGEGMCYLQVVIEKITNRSLEDLMQERVFKPLGMHTSSFMWQKRFEDNYCFGHNREGQIQKDTDNDARAASTLETTLEDYSLFIEALLKGKILDKSSIKEMFSPQIRIKSKKQFGRESLVETTKYDNINLSYGLGWGLFESPFGYAAFKEGHHHHGWQHYSVIFPERETGIIIMTNSANGESIFKELLEVAIGDIYTPWQWENYIPYNQERTP